MASIRKTLKENKNNSKNTRMDFGFGVHSLNLRPDELCHLSRYDLAIKKFLEESERQGKPVKILNVGCGEMLDLSLFYAGYVIEKKTVIKEYHGMDIDENLRAIEDRAYFKGCNAKLHIQDLTVKPKLPFPDNYFDFAFTFETIEHMGKEFIEPWIKEVKRVLKPGKEFLVSTPNHECSNQKLPKDHVYEWGFNELKNLLAKHFYLEYVTGGFMQLRFFDKMVKQTAKKIGPKTAARLSQERHLIEGRFGRHWTRVILAYKYPEYSQNCIWRVRKVQ
jgi:SAM-dependent methyltransferase